MSEKIESEDKVTETKTETPAEKKLTGIKYVFVHMCIHILRAFVHVYFRPKAIYVDKKQQTNKFKNPTVIIANHTAYWDPPFLLSVLRGKKTIVIAKDMYEQKGIHWIAQGMNPIPVDRFSMDTDWLLLAKKAIKDGKSVIIFPEGKTRKDGELNEFKSGFAFLARTAGVPVVSIGLDGNYKFGHKIHYVVGVPEKVTRTPGVPSSQDLAQKSEYFRQKVYSYKQSAVAGKLLEESKEFSNQ